MYHYEGKIEKGGKASTSDYLGSIIFVVGKSPIDLMEPFLL